MPRTVLIAAVVTLGAPGSGGLAREHVQRDLLDCEMRWKDILDRRQIRLVSNDDDDVVHELRSLYAPPAGDAYWNELQARITSRVDGVELGCRRASRAPDGAGS